MASILPFGFDSEAGNELCRELLRLGNAVHVCVDPESFRRTLHLRGHRIDLVILYMSLSNRFCRDELAEVSAYRAANGCELPLLCVVEPSNEDPASAFRPVLTEVACDQV